MQIVKYSYNNNYEGAKNKLQIKKDYREKRGLKTHVFKEVI